MVIASGGTMVQSTGGGGFSVYSLISRDVSSFSPAQVKFLRMMPQGVL